MKQIGGQAVVLGAGMAGLLAARVLADAYRRVTVVERDPLPQIPANRKGVPQGGQASQYLGLGNRKPSDFVDTHVPIGETHHANLVHGERRPRPAGLCVTEQSRPLNAPDIVHWRGTPPRSTRGALTQRAARQKDTVSRR